MLRVLRYILIPLFSLASFVFAQPADDLCSGATTITCGATVSGSTNTATFDKVDLCGTNNTAPGVWYQFVGTGDFITLSTCSAGSNFDTKISVFEGSCNALACVGGNDDDLGCSVSIRSSKVEFLSTVGKNYYILVHGFARATGNFSLSLQCGTPTTPVNDDCSNAISVACGSLVQGTTIGATADVVPSCTGAAAAPGVWYSFTGNGDRFALSLCNADFDTQIGVYTGSCGNLTCVTGNDDFCGLQSLTLLRSVPNQTYYVLVYGFDTETGNFNLELACESMPANDDCIDAAPLTCGNTELGSTQGAVIDNTPLCNGLAQSAPGVWYSFTGDGNVATLSTCSILTTFDTRLSVFTGSCTGLTCVLENDDAACLFGSRFSEASFLTTNGEQYYVLVHGFGGQTGDFALSLNCAPLPAAPANDLVANAQTIICGDSLGGTTIGATTDTFPDCGMLVGAPGVWYEFIGTGDEITLSTCDSNTDFDTQLGVYREVNGSLQCVAGNDDDLGCVLSSTNSSVKFFTNLNQRYLILVQGFNGEVGNFSLTTSCVNVGPVLVEECQISEFDPGNNLSFMIFLAGTPGLSPDYLPVGGSGRILRYSDGTAEVQGRVVNRFDLNNVWDLHMFLEDQRTWAQWSAAGGHYKGGRPEALTNHPDWSFYKLTPGSYLSGQNNFAGDTLWLQHAPIDFKYGFQLGTGANDRNGLEGISGWFTFTGSYSGHGDLNAAFTSCQRFKRARIKLQLEGPQAANGMRTTLNSSGLLSDEPAFCQQLEL
jgi:hypothetical protein